MKLQSSSTHPLVDWKFEISCFNVQNKTFLELHSRTQLHDSPEQIDGDFFQNVKNKNDQKKILQMDPHSSVLKPRDSKLILKTYIYSLY